MKKEKSCGALIIKDNKILLVKQVKGYWAFPKGHVEEGETEFETAIREVKEETNVDIKIISEKRYVTSYFLPNGNLKEVILFLAEPISDVLIKQDCEILETNYFDFEQAGKLLTYDNIHTLFLELLDDLKISNK